jgi:hypothetical protein
MYIMTLPTDALASSDRNISEQWIGKTVEGSGRDITPGTILEGLDKTMKPSEKTTGLRAKVETLDLPNSRLYYW